MKVEDCALRDWFCSEVLPLEAALTAFISRNWREPNDIIDLRQEIYERVLLGASSCLPRHTSGYLYTVARKKRVWDIDDEYLFGPALLVAPVTEYKARSRSVYLPAGTRWYDFYTGRSYEGGQTISADAPYERIPLFVRAGSIVPTGPAIQYTDQDPAGPITLNVYTGADGSTSVYNDDGVSRQYLNGHYSRIPLRWDEKTHSLWIGPREGSGYAGMPASRRIYVRWIKPGTPLSFTAKSDVAIVYDGKPQTVRMRG